jgi:hypothetical protein
MRVNNELTSLLLDIEDECKERVEQLVKQMSEKENVTKNILALKFCKHCLQN